MADDGHVSKDAAVQGGAASEPPREAPSDTEADRLEQGHEHRHDATARQQQPGVVYRPSGRGPANGDLDDRIIMGSRPRGAPADDEVMPRTTVAMHAALMNILEGKKNGEDIPPGATAIINALFYHRTSSGPAASGLTKNNRGASSNNRGASSNNRGASSHNHGSSSGARSQSAKRTTSRPPPPAGVNVDDHKRDGRPYCNYDGCKKPVRHFFWECFQKSSKGKKKAKTTTSAVSGSSKKPAHDSSSDDESCCPAAVAPVVVGLFPVPPGKA
ncbi:unnamed protein product [Pylaiella littoralis]